MSLLDKIKPQAPRIRPTELTVRDRNVLLHWPDQSTTSIDMRFLRQRCPCASCVEEWSGRRLLNPDSVPPTVRPVGMHEVGRYAVQIEWSDGHSTGIYSWDLLLKLGEELARIAEESTARLEAEAEAASEKQVPVESKGTDAN